MVFLALAESIQLIPDGTLFVHIAIIVVMVFVLNKVLFGPVNRVLEERERRTRGRSGEARGILDDVEKSISRYEHSLREARTEGYRLLEQQRAEAMQERKLRLEMVREEVDNLTEKQKATLRRQAAEARLSLESEARVVASSVSAQILGRQISSSTQESTHI